MTPVKSNRRSQRIQTPVDRLVATEHVRLMLRTDTDLANGGITYYDVDVEVAILKAARDVYIGFRHHPTRESHCEIFWTTDPPLNPGREQSNVIHYLEHIWPPVHTCPDSLVARIECLTLAMKVWKLCAVCTGWSFDSNVPCDLMALAKENGGRTFRRAIDDSLPWWPVLKPESINAESIAIFNQMMHLNNSTANVDQPTAPQKTARAEISRLLPQRRQMSARHDQTLISPEQSEQNDLFANSKQLASGATVKHKRIRNANRHLLKSVIAVRFVDQETANKVPYANHRPVVEISIQTGVHVLPEGSSSWKHQEALDGSQGDKLKKHQRRALWAWVARWHGQVRLRIATKSVAAPEIHEHNDFGDLNTAMEAVSLISKWQLIGSEDEHTQAYERAIQDFCTLPRLRNVDPDFLRALQAQLQLPAALPPEQTNVAPLQDGLRELTSVPGYLNLETLQDLLENLNPRQQQFVVDAVARSAETVLQETAELLSAEQAQAVESERRLMELRKQLQSHEDRQNTINGNVARMTEEIQAAIQCVEWIEGEFRTTKVAKKLT